MSKLAIQGAATGTGVFTIASPATNTDRTLTLPDEAGTVLTSASDVAASALTGDIAAARITTALNATGSAPIYACRAWVNFNGTGTVAIRASGNVSSITDNGTGNYTVNLTNALPDTDASVLVSAGGMDSGVYVTFPTLGSYNSATNFILSTTQVRVYQSSAGNPNQTDPYFYCVAIFR